MPSESITLTIVQLDLVNSTKSIEVIYPELQNNGLRLFIENIGKIVDDAFKKSVSSFTIDTKLTQIDNEKIKVVQDVIDAELPPTNLSEKPDFNRITEAMADGYKLTFQSVECAYLFVKQFCELVKKRNETPNIKKWVFRIGAATDDIDYDESSRNQMVGIGFVRVKELETGAYPGWLFVDEPTYNALNALPEKITDNFSLQKFKNKKEEVKQAWGCQMMSDASLTTTPPQSQPPRKSKFDKKPFRTQITINNLLKILGDLSKEQNTAINIQRSYRACSPEGWEHLITDEIEKILENVYTMPQGELKYTRVELFVACLVADFQNSPSASRKLQGWAEKKINEFSDLLNQAKDRLKAKKQNKNSHLLIAIDDCKQKSALSHDSNYYTVKAWVIEDIEIYNYNTGTGCKPITLSDFDDKSFAIDENHKVEIKKLLNKCLEECLGKQHECNRENLTIEIFLPLAVLNYPVDCCEYEDNFGSVGLNNIFIGQRHKLVIRCYERLRPIYDKTRINSWEPKWKRLQEHFTCPSVYRDFILGDEENVKALIYVLDPPEIIGLKVVKAPKNIGEGSIFAVIFKTGIPVALWLKKNPPSLDCQSEIEQILSCCIRDLPETVREKRLDAKDNSDTHIGHHLSLLWEDPYSVPPTIHYINNR
ncbi:hypothetical protein NIES4074_64160 (plasmid) [Cylindrospermum sp. NIES-4074]|nr:hypothetical protein NIES4074_64160 [Cylindrospermum sp. NIES-4074]